MNNAELKKYSVLLVAHYDCELHSYSKSGNDVDEIIVEASNEQDAFDEACSIARDKGWDDFSFSESYIDLIDE